MESGRPHGTEGASRIATEKEKKLGTQLPMSHVRWCWKQRIRRSRRPKLEAVNDYGKLPTTKTFLTHCRP